MNKLSDLFDSEDDSFQEGIDIYMGFNRLRSPDECPFSMPLDALCCSVQLLKEHEINNLNSKVEPPNFKHGDYAVFTLDADSNIRIEGPFRDLKAAFDYARENYGAVRFMSDPEII